MKKQIKGLLWSNPSFGEAAFVTNRATSIAPGEQFPVNSNNVPANIQVNGQYVSVSRIGPAFENTPGFVLHGHDTNGCSYGTLHVAGYDAKWRCDGKTLWTTLPFDDEDLDEDDGILSRNEVYRIFLYPFVTWYENQNEDMRAFRNIYQQTQASHDDCVKVSLAFEYGYLPDHQEVEVIAHCNDSLCEPATSRDIVVTEKGNTDIMTSGLPWQNASGGPTALSVANAQAGKFNLGGSWGVITEGNRSYNFAADMVSPVELENYIDNPYFHDCLQQVVGYIGSLFRSNKLYWDGTSMNDFLREYHVKMRGSNQQNIMLAGEPGSGKTLLPRMLAATLGMPCLVVRLSERSEKEELTQEVVATDHGFDTLKSALYWYVKYGGIVVFDDLSNADPNMFFSVTGGLLESPYEYSVNQEVVKRHPLCLMFATANVGTIGSQPMNEALLTRFGGHYVVERLSDEAFKACIMSRAESNSGVTVKKETANLIANWTYNAFQSVFRAIKKMDAETADRLITMRAAISTAEKILNAVAEGYPVECKHIASQTMANILYTGGNPTLQKAVRDAIDSTPALKLGEMR